MEIIDAHAHVTAGTIDLLRERMRRLGIDRTVVVAGGTIAPWDLARQATCGGGRDERVDNHFVLAAAQSDPRLVPFYFVSPAVPVTPALADEIRGAAGLKLAPAVHGFGFDDSFLPPYLDLAQKLGLPVYSHCLFAERAGVGSFARLARLYPDITFILGHAGRHYFDLPAIEEIETVDNVWFETSGAFEFVVREAVRRLGPARVVFGSEFPLQGQESELCKVRAAVEETAAVQVLGGNMARLLSRRPRLADAVPGLPTRDDDRRAYALASAAATRAYSSSPALRARLEVSGHCLDFVPLANEPERWSRLPFTSKADLREAYPFGMLAVPTQKVAIVHESSGSTGTPTPSFLTAEDLDDCHDRILENAIDLRAGDVVLVKTPYAMLSTAHQMHGAALKRGATVVPADNRSTLMPYARAVRLIQAYGVTVIYCLPIELLLFARKAIRLGRRPGSDFPSLRACLVNGEPLSAGKRQFIERLWGARVYQDYGSTETNSLAGECDAGALHLWEDRFFFELVDPRSGISRRAGAGELVVTSLRRQAMPLVRFRTGDVVTIERAPCSCGRADARVEIGCRASDFVRCQGREATPGQFEDLVYRKMLGLGPLFWSLEHDEHICELRLEPLREERTEVATRLPNLVESISRELGLVVDVRLVEEGTLVRQDQDGDERGMHKPRYVRRRGESADAWGPGLNYADEALEKENERAT